MTIHRKNQLIIFISQLIFIYSDTKPLHSVLSTQGEQRPLGPQCRLEP